MKYRVCLIVDNPLRDLEGITLIAWHLAKQNIISYIVPMYCQAFDIIAIKPDLVVTNYLRPNNIALLQRYKKENIKICILDTEGSPGRDIAKFSNFIFNIKEKNLVNLYCLWGNDQYKSFKKINIFNDEILKITGCPRYDFCIHPYNKIFHKDFYEKKFILINTTFPVGNPKFTKNFNDESKAMIDMGYDRKFANQYAKDSFEVNRKIISIIERICKTVPNVNFVLRPHPFESRTPYEKLLRFPNFEINQTKTAIEWLNSCEALIHLNCQTAIEAVMLGKEPISLEWVNTPHLKAQAPPGEINHNPKSFNELIFLIKKISNNNSLKPSSKMKMDRKKLIKSRLLSNDGKSSLRVSKVIFDYLNINKHYINNSLYSNSNYKVNYKQFGREVLGFNLFHTIRKIIQGKKFEFRRNEKSFNLNDVNLIINKLNKLTSKKQIVQVGKVESNELSIAKMSSQQTIKVFK